MTETQATPACGETSARAHACAAAMVPGGVGPCIDAETNFENRADFGHPTFVAAKFRGSAAVLALQVIIIPGTAVALLVKFT